jgi:hypothetical protein
MSPFKRIIMGHNGTARWAKLALVLFHAGNHAIAIGNGGPTHPKRITRAGAPFFWRFRNGGSGQESRDDTYDNKGFHGNCLVVISTRRAGPQFRDDRTASSSQAARVMRLPPRLAGLRQDSQRYTALRRFFSYGGWQ